MTLLALVLALPLLAGCARRDEAAPLARESELLVFAAASLRDAFTALEPDFERTHPGVEVTFNFAGTQELRTQLEHGAAVDVLASADSRHMDALARAGHVERPALFARNEPVIIASAESGARVQSLADLPSAERIVLGTPEVPIGRYALQVLDRAEAALGAGFRARVEARVSSRELNVRQVLTKVRLGEADAGIVYRTDARAAQGSVRVVEIPPQLNVVAEYPIAVAAHAPHPMLAREWIDLVLSSAGQGALREAGFVAIEERPAR